MKKLYHTLEDAKYYEERKQEMGIGSGGYFSFKQDGQGGPGGGMFGQRIEGGEDCREEICAFTSPPVILIPTGLRNTALNDV